MEENNKQEQNLEEIYSEKETMRHPYFFFMRNKEKYLSNLRLKNKSIDSRFQSRNTMRGSCVNINDINFLKGALNKALTSKKKSANDNKDIQTTNSKVYSKNYLGNSLCEETKDFIFSNNGNKMKHGMDGIQWKKIMNNYNLAKKSTFNSTTYFSKLKMLRPKPLHLKMSNFELPCIYRPKNGLRSNSLKQFCQLKTKSQLIDFYRNESQKNMLSEKCFSENKNTRKY